MDYQILNKSPDIAIAVVPHYVDANGRAIGTAVATPLPVTQTGSSVGAQTSVPASISDTTILAANAVRRRATITNDSTTATLFLLFSAGTASVTNWSVALPPSGMWEELVYTGVIKGVWSGAFGNARVTENT